MALHSSGGALAPMLNAGGAEAGNPKAQQALDELEKMRKQLEDLGEASSISAKLRDLKFREELASVELRILQCQAEGREQEALALIKYKKELKKGQDAIQLQLLKNGEYSFKEDQERNVLKSRLLVDEAMARQETERAVRTTEVSAQKAKEATIESAKETAKIWANKFSDPRFAALAVGGTVTAALGIYSAKHGTALIADWLRIPKLAQKTSIKTLPEKISNYFRPREEEVVKLSDLVFEPKLSKRSIELAEAIKTTVENNTYFRHMLFYGPPGTGKTMLAMALAYYSGLEFIYFSAAKLEMYSTKEGLRQLVALFEYAKKSTKKYMIIMDEADVLCADRTGDLADKTKKLLNTLLTYTGTECRDYIVVALTNRYEVLDDAVLNRLGVQLEIGPPALQERKLLLNSYVNKYLEEYRMGIEDKRSSLEKLYKKNKARLPLLMDEDVANEEFWDGIARQTEGFVGREISDMCLAIQQAAFISKERRVTRELVQKAVAEQIAQRINGQKKKNRNKVGQVK